MPKYLKRTNKPITKKNDKHLGFQCEYCVKMFRDEVSYKIHMEIHTGEFSYNCEICDQGFKNKKYVARHIRRVHSERRNYDCSVCDKSFHYPNGLKAHMRVHTGEKPYKCKECGKGFSSTYCLGMHNLIHTGEKPYKCKYCEYACRDSSTLRRHEERHLGILKTYTCSICDKVFKKKKTLETHVDEVHFGIDIRTFTCNECGKAFKTQKTVTRHVQLVHQKLFRTNCDICGAEVSKLNIKAHLRIHVDIKPFMCTYKKCRKRFKDKGGLKRHYITHFPAKQYYCSRCGRRFSRKTRLNKHARQHLPDSKVAQCYYCLQVFPNKNGLGQHINKKHGKNCQKYICDTCGLEVFSKRLLILHFKYGHGMEKNLTCKICYKLFSDHITFRTHYLNHHNVYYTVLDKKETPADIVIKREMTADNDDTNVEFNYEVQIVKQENYVLPKKIVNETQYNKMEKSINELVAKSKMEKELVELERVRCIYNERILLAVQKRKDGREPKSVKSIKYFNKPAKETTSEEINAKELDDNKNNSDIIEDTDTNKDNINSENYKSVKLTSEEINEQADGKITNNDNTAGEYSEKNINNDNTAVENNGEITDDGKCNGKITDDDNKEENNDAIINSENNKGEKNDEIIDNVNNEGDNSEIAHNNNTAIENNAETIKEVHDENKSNGESEYEEESDNDDDSDYETNKANKKKNNNKININALQCHICFSLFKTKEELKKHCIIHFDLCNEKMLIKCPFCGYVTDKNIRVHIKKKHDVVIKIPYAHIKEKKKEKGSKYIYETNQGELEIIPSISNLNKIALVNIDKKNRDQKNNFIGITKLVKKGGNWVIDKDEMTVTNESLLPQFDEKEYKKIKKVGIDYCDRLKSLYILAKRRKIKMLFPCKDCDKVCLNLAGLKLHTRRHEDNPTPFRPKVWVNRIIKKKYNTKKSKNTKKTNNKNNNTKNVKEVNKELNNTNARKTVSNKTKNKTARLTKITSPNDLVEHRYSKPNPVKNKHKCDKKLIDFYNSNIKGRDIEFWQFLKIFNKMSRDNVNTFEDLKKSTNFGIHIDLPVENNSNNTENNSNNTKNTSTSDVNEVNNTKIGKTKCNSTIKSNNKVNKTKTNLKSKTIGNNKVKKVLLSKKERLIRNKLKDEMRRRMKDK